VRSYSVSLYLCGVVQHSCLVCLLPFHSVKRSKLGRMKPFLEVFQLLNAHERRHGYALVPGIILMACLEVASIAAMSPFLSLVTNPDGLQTNRLLGWIYSTFRFESTRSFVVFMGIVTLALLVTSNVFSLFMNWLLVRFAWLKNHALSERLLAQYLAKPYSFFLERNTSELGKNILAEVQQVVKGLLVPGMVLFSNVTVVLFILVFLIILNPVRALVVAGVLSSGYVLVYTLLQRRIVRYGAESLRANERRYQVAHEALGGIKDIKVLGRENVFLGQFAKVSKVFSVRQALGETLSSSPRYVLDTLAFGTILTLMLILYARDTSQVIPVVGVYALAGYRLMPALQQIYRHLTQAHFHTSVLATLRRDLENLAVAFPEISERLPFQDRLELADISFKYPTAKETLFKNLSLSIASNTSVAFVGATGSGKTTLVDILLGLLTPDAGKLLIDREALTQDNLRNWQANLGYVPQTIFLSDGTIAENIAFGISSEKIDMEAVIKAATIANLHDFVSTLPEGYNTVVGERGVRLSGGQRQRIGIARALYHDPSVLILDEATSALDNVTEEAVFQAIKNVMGKKTVIMIAHRISTVQDCDTIFVLEKGHIIAQGSYQALLLSSPHFQALARQGHDHPNIYGN
jgi:ATP-binding cassette, subfamily B, bacterial PglK